MIRRYVENNRRVILWTLMSGVLNEIFWFYLLMIVMFPNYLFEIGKTAIV